MPPYKEIDNLQEDGENPSLPPNIVQQQQAASKETKEVISKPHRIKNYFSGTEHYDTLHRQAPQDQCCGVSVCKASTWYTNIVKNPLGANPSLNIDEEVKLLSQAKDFFNQYYASIKQLDTVSHLARWNAVQREIRQTGSYDLTLTELSFGIKLAWRNAPRCIGRIQWNKIQLFDYRHVTTARGMFEALCDHLKYATNGGNIRTAAIIFPQRKPGQTDFRIWNSQMISYAGYRTTAPPGENCTTPGIIGDPSNIEFTEMCQKLGWRGAGTDFDVLPLVLQAANCAHPEVFEIPKELILEVQLQHPTFDWFSQLGLKWFGVPVITGLAVDCGGLIFPALPFNGWYTSFEIGTRNLTDSNRYNKLELVAKKMGLNTSSPTTLWKDRAVLELNAAVLHSFQKQGVTIVDHHTVTESFMTFYETEMRTRGGCPAEWIWLVPPISGSLTPVYHQEMLNYTLKPSFEYQEAFKNYKWDQVIGSTNVEDHRNIRLKEVALAVRFTASIFGKAVQRRIRATILYATETGKSEKFAKNLANIFNNAFNAQAVCMVDLDVKNFKHESLVMIVTSTFGNGEGPENAQDFTKELNAIKENKYYGVDHLKNVKFAVFALGSSAYPNFCAFGYHIDNLLSSLGGERIASVTTGDELNGQEHAFKSWAPKIFQTSREFFCLKDDIAYASVGLVDSLTSDTIRFFPTEDDIELAQGFSKTHNKNVFACPTIFRDQLTFDRDERKTIHVGMKIGNNWSGKSSYQPGDHIGILASNREELVDMLMTRLTLNRSPLPKGPIQLRILSAQKDGRKIWEDQERLPACDLKTLLSRYIDITAPPSQAVLALLAAHATADADKNQLQLLATDSQKYEDWKYWGYKNLLETLKEFPSVSINAAVLISQLPLIQPRFYSISSSPLDNPNQVDITAAIVKFKTEDGKGPVHSGLCTHYLNQLEKGDLVYCFVRSAPNFHLPTEITRPVVMVGSGTGMAPFRGFWHQKRILQSRGETTGPMVLFSGCRAADSDLHAEEKAAAVNEGVLDHSFLALSRSPPLPKTYVQDKLLEEAQMVYRMLTSQNGHFYVCGDYRMAEDVTSKLKVVFQRAGGLSIRESETLLAKLKEEKRFHEDIFGITYRAPNEIAASQPV